MTSSRRSILPWRRSVISPVPQDGAQPKAEPSVINAVRLEMGQSASTDSSFLTWNAGSNQTVVNPYDRHHHPRSALRQGFGFWRLILFRKCIDQHSKARKWWLLLLLSNLCYGWIMVPVQVTFPLWQRPSWIIQAVDTISNVGLWLDLVLNFSLSFMIDSEKIMDPERSAQRYFKHGFVFDLLCAVPFEYLNVTRYGLLRLPRLLRIFT